MRREGLTPNPFRLLLRTELLLPPLSLEFPQLSSQLKIIGQSLRGPGSLTPEAPRAGTPIQLRGGAESASIQQS